MIKAIKITPTDVPRLVEIGSDLQSLQAAVGGYIEVLVLAADAVALIDEEAKVKAAPPAINGIATAIAKDAGIRADDCIRGPMIIVGCRDGAGKDDGEFHDVPPRWIERLPRRGGEG